MISKSVLTIANTTRLAAEILNKDFEPDLGGSCYQVSKALAVLLQPFAKAKVVHGLFVTKQSIHVPHGWVVVQGWIVDCTASQFDGLGLAKYPKTFIVKPPYRYVATGNLSNDLGQYGYDITKLVKSILNI